MHDWKDSAVNRDAFMSTDPRSAVPRLLGSQAQNFVARHQGIRRVLASSAPAAVLYESGLSPKRFAHGDGTLLLPDVLIECGQGQWFGLNPDSVKVGYVGSAARAALRALGVPEQLADRIAHEPFSDVRFDGRGNVIGVPVHRSLPPHDLPAPRWMQGEWVVIVSGEPSEVIVSAETEDCALESKLHTWASFLNEDGLPLWLTGPRGNLVFLDPADAVSSGFTTDPDRRPTLGLPVTIIIRQGRLALWIACPMPLGPAVRLHRIAYEVLELFGFELERLRQRDAGPAWKRRLLRLLGPDQSRIVATRR